MDIAASSFKDYIIIYTYLYFLYVFVCLQTHI